MTPSDVDMLTCWQRMTDLYGHRWLSAYGEPTVSERDRTGEPVERLSPTVRSWQRVLSGIGPAELRRGMAECVGKGEAWPPTAPQFRERCRPHRETYERAEFQQPALPAPANPEVGRRALAGIRARLGMAGTSGSHA